MKKLKNFNLHQLLKKGENNSTYIYVYSIKEVYTNHTRTGVWMNLDRQVMHKQYKKHTPIKQ